MEAATDSNFVFEGISDRGPVRATAYCSAWASLWRVFWKLLEDFGGLGESGLVVRNIKAHSTSQAVESGLASRRDKFGNSQADVWARHSTARMRVPED
eukprot:8138-Pyramimonas_sp.AAC.1